MNYFEARIEIDERGQILYADPCASAMFMLSQDKVVQHSVNDLIIPELRKISAMCTGLSSNMTASGSLSRQGRRKKDVKLLGRRLNGDFFPIEVALVKGNNSNGRAGLLLHDASDREVLRNRLDEYQKANARLCADIENARERERNSIARELHDDVGQLLTICQLGISQLSGKVDDNVAKELDYIDSLLFRSIACIRQLRSGLQPAIFDQLSLTSALNLLVGEFSRFIKIDLFIGNIRELPVEVSSAAYRTVQEALTNITRHANAFVAKIEVKIAGPNLFVNVSDDGQGIGDADAAMRMGCGLYGMRERAEASNGSFSIQQGVPTGTSIQVVLPIHATRNHVRPDN